MSTSKISLASVVLGSLICAALLFAFAMLGGGLGLVSIGFTHGITVKPGAIWGAGIYALVVVIISAWLGGFAAARLSGREQRSSCFWHGVGSWSLVIVAFGFTAVLGAGSMGSVLVEAGVGTAAGAGAAASVDEITERLSQVRIVTDMHLLKGKAVTQIVVPKPEKQLAGTAAEKVPGELRGAKKNIAPTLHARHELKEAAGTAKSVAASLFFGLLALMIVGALAAGAGSALAARRAQAGSHGSP